MAGKLKIRGSHLQVGAAAATIIATLVAVLVYFGLQPGRSKSSHDGPSNSLPATSLSTSGPPTSAGSPPPAVTTGSAPPVSEVATFLDDYAKECGIAVDVGPVKINGQDHVHAIQQWAGDTTSSFTISRVARSFHAVVGIRDDAKSDVQVQFELQGDNGKQLFMSKPLNFGETQSVDVSVEGVLRISLVVHAVSRVWGYAGWGDAQLTSDRKLPC